LRVRAIGFKETTLPLLAANRGLSVKLVRTTDQAELTFKQRMLARRRGRSSQKNAANFSNRLQRRPAYPAAHLGLARVLP